MRWRRDNHTRFMVRNGGIYADTWLRLGLVELRRCVCPARKNHPMHGFWYVTGHGMRIDVKGPLRGLAPLVKVWRLS
jgi:hypothetical protein